MGFLRNYETAFIVAPIVFLLAWLFNCYKLGKLKKIKDFFKSKTDK